MSATTTDQTVETLPVEHEKGLIMRELDHVHHVLENPGFVIPLLGVVGLISLYSIITLLYRIAQ